MFSLVCLEPARDISQRHTRIYCASLARKMLLFPQILHSNVYWILRINIFNLLGRRRAGRFYHCELPYYVALHDEADKNKEKCFIGSPGILRSTR